ncbi:hypothetical protein EIP91_004717 [Steccherinum ochraceum]|uniref:BTB domain-containing protein n=1 Tax=Steccherinum ochraceum TaxID=92696 RepID=A0A4R0RNQ1_9APHY|nr:hypothetical protein EIP91_004717 [Steccherinum ochraceum]
MDSLNENRNVMPDPAGIAGGRIRYEQEGEAIDQLSRTAHPVATSIDPSVPGSVPSLHLPPQRECSVSTAFHAELLAENSKPDVVLVSSDNVIFYAHTYLLLSLSDNSFNGLLGVEAIGMARGIVIGPHWVVGVPTGSILFNVIIHTIYNISCKQFEPSLEVLLQAVASLKTYGISIDLAVGRDMPLYNHIVAEMPQSPIDVFLVAAENDLDTLAVAASAHLLSLSLPDITDEMADRMGPLYLKRLVSLHSERTGYLKQLLADVPKPHEDTANCGPAEQRKLSRAWALAASGLMWDIRSDLPPGVLRSTLVPLEQQLNCEQCKTSLVTRIHHLVLDWSTKAKVQPDPSLDDANWHFLGKGLWDPFGTGVADASRRQPEFCMNFAQPSATAVYHRRQWACHAVMQSLYSSTQGNPLHKALMPAVPTFYTCSDDRLAQGGVIFVTVSEADIFNDSPATGRRVSSVTDEDLDAASSPETISLDVAPVAPSQRAVRPTLQTVDIAGPVSLSPSPLHSTPFDVSGPRFEHPFPETAPDSKTYQGAASPAFSGLVPPSVVKAVSPTYHKLRTEDPPVPPSLANKRRWSSASVSGVSSQPNNDEKVFERGGTYYAGEEPLYFGLQ